MQEKQLHRVIRIAQYRCLAIECAGIDFGSGMVGHKSIARYPPFQCRGFGIQGEIRQPRCVRTIGGNYPLIGTGDAHPYGTALSGGGRQRHHHKIIGNAINRELSPPICADITRQCRLVIAGYRTGQLPVLAYLPRREIALKKGFRQRAIIRQRLRLTAHTLPCWLRLQARATLLKRRQAAAKHLLLPLRQAVVRHGLITHAVFACIMYIAQRHRLPRSFS